MFNVQENVVVIHAEETLSHAVISNKSQREKSLRSKIKRLDITSQSTVDSYHQRVSKKEVRVQNY